MNKRQAKKKFKKKYGVTPAEMADNICKSLSNFVPIVIDAYSKVIDMLNDLGDSIQNEDFEKIARAIMKEGEKMNCKDCIHNGTDACTHDEICEDFIPDSCPYTGEKCEMDGECQKCEVEAREWGMIEDFGLED